VKRKTWTTDVWGARNLEARRAPVATRTLRSQSSQLDTFSTVSGTCCPRFFRIARTLLEP